MIDFGSHAPDHMEPDGWPGTQCLPAELLVYSLITVDHTLDYHSVRTLERSSMRAHHDKHLGTELHPNPLVDTASQLRIGFFPRLIGTVPSGTLQTSHARGSPPNRLGATRRMSPGDVDQ